MSKIEGFLRAEMQRAQEKAVLLGDTAAAAVRSLPKEDPKIRPIRLSLLAALKRTGYKDLPPE